MRQLEITAPHSVEWREAADPRIEGDGQALVKPLAVATCDLDGAFLTGAIPLPGRFPLATSA